MACAWVYLAFRHTVLLGAGERLEDAQQVCVTEAARKGEGTLHWYAAQEGHESSHERRGGLVLRSGQYEVRRVPVARFADGEGGG